jgi:hypothetical protein
MYSFSAKNEEWWRKEKKGDRHTIGSLCRKERKKEKRKKSSNRRLLAKIFFVLSFVLFYRSSKRSLTVVGFEPTPQVTST